MRTFTISIELSRLREFFCSTCSENSPCFCDCNLQWRFKKGIGNQSDLKLLRTKLLIPDLEKLQLELSVI